MPSAVLLCLTYPGKRRLPGQRIRAAHIAPDGRDVGRGGELKEALGEEFPADIRASVQADG